MRQTARIRTVHEAVIQRLNGESAEVSTTHPVARGERLVLRFTTVTGEMTVNLAEVVSCTPHACDDGMQWRLVLSLVPAGVGPQQVR